MSEVQSRPPRGRTSARGGRGGPRGGARAGNRHINGDSKAAVDIDTTANEGELGDLKKQYSNELSMLKEMFPGWTDADLLLALEDSRGDVTSTIDHITSGAVSQFAEVQKKAKDKTKPKEGAVGAPETATSTSRPPRGRGGAEAGRGASRGRPDRGRGGLRSGARGGPHGGANGARSTSAAVSVPTADSTAWDAIGDANHENTTAGTASGDVAPGGQQGSVLASEIAPKTAAEGVKSSLIPDSGAKKTWASMFAPKPPPKAKPPQVKASEKQQPPVTGTDPTAANLTHTVPTVEPPVEDAIAALPPSKDELTEENIEHLPDYSNNAPATETAASQVGSAHDIGGSVPGSGTPSLANQPIGSARPGLGGYATSATKAMAGTGRSASFQRRVQEQQESLVMPGQHALDRVGVQFGMMGLNGDALEVDEDREDAETRPQAPPLSPPTQPRASLPPAPRQAPPAESAPETLPTPKQAPGLPPVPQQLSQQQQPSPNPVGAQIMSQQGSQGYSRYGGLGQPSAQTDAAAPSTQRYDPFGQQAGQNPLDAYNSQQGQQGQSHIGGQTSGPGDYSSYYASEQQRNTYHNYYGGGYGQQHGGQQDAGAAQQRTGSAFGSAPGDSSYSAQSQQGNNQSRYGEAQGSGNNTPNPQPSSGGQHQPQQGQQIHQQQHGQGQQGGFPGYGSQAHPYYNSPYYQAYMNQYNYGNQGYGGPYGGGGQGGRYGQSHQGYGIPPQQSGYGEHSASPANTGSYGQSNVARDSAHGSSTSGLGDYGRSGSTQPSQTQSSSASGFGGLGADYSRGQTGYGGSQGYGQHGGQQSSEDSLKPYGDTKASGGPSPGLGQPGRPGSATNTSGSQGQSGLPPPQSHQQGFGGYPSQYGGQGSQYGSGLGGLGGHQGGQNHQGGFGGYGGGYGNYGSYGRGGSGWGNNYGGH